VPPAANVAVTELAALKVKLQPAVPVHAPDQPLKTLLAAGVSVSVTWVLGGNVAEQVPGHEIPAGLLVTVPDPAPAIVTDKASPAPKAAVTLSAPVTVRLHVVPEHAPPHPTKKLLPGVSLSVTFVFWGNTAAHIVGQLIPAGLLVTVVPVPPPVMATVTPSPAINDAVTLAAAVIVTLQVIPEHAPLHPPKMKLAPGVAVSVTFVFLAKLAVHVVGQLIPDGLLVTVPELAAGGVTVNWNVVAEGVAGEVEPLPAPQLVSARVEKPTKINQNNGEPLMAALLRTCAKKRSRSWMKSPKEWLVAFLAPEGNLGLTPRLDYSDFCCLIHLSVRASRRSSGRVPPSSISSWNLRMSNLEPSSFWARSRNSRIFNCPSL
jgi:hypothetical protein